MRALSTKTSSPNGLMRCRRHRALVTACRWRGMRAGRSRRGSPQAADPASQLRAAEDEDGDRVHPVLRANVRVARHDEPAEEGSPRRSSSYRGLVALLRAPPRSVRCLELRSFRKQRCAVGKSISVAPVTTAFLGSCRPIYFLFRSPRPPQTEREAVSGEQRKWSGEYSPL